MYLLFPSHLIVAQTAETRANIQSALNRRLSQRPAKIELEQRNIIADTAARSQELEERKSNLERKLSRRPTVKELRERHILM